MEPLNLILIEATIITLDPRFPETDWAVIAKDRIAEIGHKSDWKALRKKGATVIDCRGKTILPGFIDTHLHVASYAKSLVTLDLAPRMDIGSISDIQTRIRGHALCVSPDNWILGKGYNEFYLAEKRHPDRWDLDQAAPNHPVRLTHRSGHAHVLNSPALKRVGIGRETGDPPGGMVERDLKTGEPTGLLYEMGGFLSDRIPPIAPQALEKGLRMANEQLVSAGVTSIQDASSRNNTDSWKLLDAWKTSGILQPRANMMLGYHTFKKKEFRNFSTASDECRLRFGAVKIILDDTTGRLHPSQSDLNAMVLEIHRAGMQIAIHAIEEQAIEAACIAIEYALDKAPRKDHRHRIEHCSVCPPNLARQIAALDIMIVCQPPFIHYNGERYLETVPERQLEHLYPFRTLLDHGIEIAGSSDCPVVPPDPLTGIYAAVSRKAETGDTVTGAEKIPPLEALKMYTRTPARAMFEDTLKGTVSPGKLADLAILNGDPTSLPPDEFEELNVEMTIINGEIVWRRDG